jgi:tetratricopeptide (TPR) repeat protein
MFEQGVGVVRSINTEEAQAVMGWLLAAQGLYCVPGGVYSLTGGTKGGYALAQQGIEIVERLNGYEEMMIVPLISLFVTASLKNEVQIAAAAAQECLEVAARLGDGWAIAKAKQFLAIEAIKRTDYEIATRLMHEALASFETNGDKWSESILCIEVMGLLAFTLSQFDRAQRWVERGLQAAEAIDFKYSQQMAYWQLGYAAALQEGYDEAGKYWHKALAIGSDTPVWQTIIGFSGSGREWG